MSAHFRGLLADHALQGDATILTKSSLSLSLLF